MWFPEITARLESSNAASNNNICQVFSPPTIANETVAFEFNTKPKDVCLIGIPEKIFIDNLVMAFGYILANTIMYICHMKIPLLHITIGSMVVSTMSAFLLPNLGNQWMIVLCFVCFIAGSSVGISILNVVLVDIFPSHLCGMAISLALLMGRIASFVALNGLGVLLESYCQVSIYGTGILLIIAVMCLFNMPKKITYDHSSLCSQI